MNEKMKKLLEKRSGILSNIQKAETEEELNKLEIQLRKINIEIKAEAQEELQERNKEELTGEDGMIEKDGISTRTQIVNALGKVISDQQIPTQRMDKIINDLSTELRNGKEVTITPEIGQELSLRAMSSTSTLIESKYSRTIKETMREVSQTIDLVETVPLVGGNTYSVAFEIDAGEAGTIAEGTIYTNDEGSFGMEDTHLAKITNSAIVNEEVLDLPDANYLPSIYNNVVKSIRKKISKQILTGKGTNTELRGIINNTVAMPAAYKKEITTIDNKSLLNIVMSYGGDEDVTGDLILSLNKKTLQLFAEVTKPDGDPYYEITYNGPEGFIKGKDGVKVKYSINSILPELTAAAAGDNVMFYGNMQAIKLVLFSPITIKISDQRYIDKGQVGFFGKVHAGCLIDSYKAIMPIKKA